MTECSNASAGVKRTSMAADSARNGKKRIRYAHVVPAVDHTAVATASASQVVDDCGDNDVLGDGSENRCTICNVDIGESNPRQLCGKWRCLTGYVHGGDTRSDGDAEDVRAVDDDDDEVDSHFPLLEDMNGSGIRAFSSLDTETIYQILQFDKRTEEFRDEKKHNMILTLRGRGCRSAIEVRATGVVQKTLSEKYELESLFTTHTFYIRYLGQKKSFQTGNMFCNFCVVTKAK